MALTIEEIEADYWAHHYHEHPSSNSAEDDDFDAEALAAAMESDDWETVINDKQS